MSFTNVPIIETEEDGAVTYAISPRFSRIELSLV